MPICSNRRVTIASESLPDDIAALKRIIAEMARDAVSAQAEIRKPQAFRHSVFRDEMFPSSIFRRTWETLDQRLDPQKACRVYVGLLHLAAMQGREAVLADHLAAVLDAGGTPDLEAARTAVVPPIITAPAVMVMAPDLAVYDELLRMPTLGDAA